MLWVYHGWTPESHVAFGRCLTEQRPLQEVSVATLPNNMQGSALPCSEIDQPRQVSAKTSEQQQVNSNFWQAILLLNVKLDKIM